MRSNNATWMGQGISLALHLIVLFLGGSILYQQVQYGVEAGAGGSAGGGAPEVLIAEVELEEPPPEPAPVVPTAIEPEPPEPEPEPEMIIEEEPAPVIESVTVEAKPEPKKENPPTAPRPAARSAGRADNAPAAVGGGGVRVTVQPRYLRNPPPRYPREARRAGAEGTVLLMVDISSGGRSESVRILRSSGHASLDQEALRAVSRWTFQPASVGGIRVPSRARVPVTFQLR